MLTFAAALVFASQGCSTQFRVDRTSNTSQNVTDAININTANESELMKLPYVGDTIAHRIVEFREQNGPFRRPENLMLVNGISEKRFKEIRPLIKTE